MLMELIKEWLVWINNLEYLNKNIISLINKMLLLLNRLLINVKVQK
jgi:hypothetical protein